MRILYIHTGRVEEQKANVLQALQMCKAFAGLGHEVRFSVNSYRLDRDQVAAYLAGQLGVALPFAVATFHGGHLFNRVRSLAAVPAVRRHLRRTPHDLAFVRDPVCFPFLPAVAPRLVHEAHNNTCFPGSPLLDRVWRRWTVRAAAQPGLERFVCISGALRDWWAAQGIPRAKLLALHDAVDPQMFAGLPAPAVLRDELGVARDRKLVVYAGSLYGDRSVDVILRLAAARPDAAFLVVGGPEEARQHYAGAAARAGLVNIRFTGRVPFAQIPRYLAAADVLLMLWSARVPTINYCSPLKVFEYMAAERVIVGHGFPTIREVLTDGKDALLADPADEAQLLAKLATALDRPPVGMAAAARARVLAEHTWTARCRAILGDSC